MKKDMKIEEVLEEIKVDIRKTWNLPVEHYRTYYEGLNDALKIIDRRLQKIQETELGGTQHDD